MTLLKYKAYRVEHSSISHYDTILQLIPKDIAKDRLDAERIANKASKLAKYICEQEHSYVVRDDDKIYGVVCMDVDGLMVELEYLYSTKQYYNVPIGLLMNYALNYVCKDRLVVCESSDVSTFESIVEPTKKEGYYMVKKEFAEFVKRYEDGK